MSRKDKRRQQALKALRAAMNRMPKTGVADIESPQLGGHHLDSDLAESLRILRSTARHGNSIAPSRPAPAESLENVVNDTFDSNLDTVHGWREGFKLQLERFPRHYRTTMSVRLSQFTFDEVYADGTITGQYRDHNQVYRIFASLSEPPAGCSCRESNGKHACVHGYAFVTRVIDWLGRDSDLTLRVREKRFASEGCRKSHFAYDPTAQAIHELLSYVNIDVAVNTELPEITEQRRERIGWQLSANVYSVELQPLIQPLNKRGDAWNKGKALDERSMPASVEHTDGDRLAFDCLAKDSLYYMQAHKVIERLSYLIGQDNVLCNGEQMDVLVGSVFLVPYSDDQGLSMRVSSDTVTADMPCYFARDGILTVDQPGRRLYITRQSPSQVSCIQALLKFKDIKSREHVDLLIERCRQLQSVINIRLPDNFGPVVADQLKPVLLLRSRSDGFLEYGIRLRDSQDKLLLPGTGPLIRSVQQDGQPVQLKRSVANEQTMVQKLQQRLELSSHQINGRLSFEQGLKLLDALQSIGDEVEILWDKQSETPLKSLGSLTSKNVRVSIQQKRDWFQISGLCELDSGNIELNDLLDSLGNDKAMIGNFVRIGDQGWARISEDLKEGLKKLADTVNHDRGQFKFDRTAAIAMRDLQNQVTIDSTRPWKECLERLSIAETLEPAVPGALQAELRDYQVEGFKWLRRLAEWGVGGVLADDMGLGKTVQTLAVIVDLAERGPSLVIAPTSVGFNWLREIKRFAPHLTVHSYRETDRSEFLTNIGPGHIVVCSYGLALRDADKLAKVTWSSMVLDEAHAIKNSQSKTSQAIATIPADWKIALTGTPVENHLGELWSLFHVISPGVFGGWEQFRRRFATPIEKNNDDERRLALRDRLKPFILRRTKREVLRDLPARTESNLIVELNDKERKLYDKYRLSVLKQASEIAQLTDIKDQRFKLLALLTRLRQIACHPRLVEPTWKDRSTKLQQLLETLQQLKEEGHRTLIFSQFVQHLHLIREMLDEEKITYQYLDGSTTPAERQQQVDQFQNGSATAFLISLKAGGTGLNLTAADYVIHMDPWWNPAVEDQATDRAHRIGQTKPVMVYRLIAENTVEQEILKLHEDKRDLVAGILDGTHAAGGLSTQELVALLTGSDQ